MMIEIASVGRGHVPAGAGTTERVQIWKHEIAETGVRTGLAMKNREPSRVIVMKLPVGRGYVLSRV